MGESQKVVETVGTRKKKERVKEYVMVVGREKEMEVVLAGGEHGGGVEEAAQKSSSHQYSPLDFKKKKRLIVF